MMKTIRKKIQNKWQVKLQVTLGNVMWAVFSMFIYGINLILCLWKPRFCFVEIWIIYVSQLHRWQSDVADLLDAKPSFFLLTISYRRWLSEFAWFVKLLEDPFKGQAPLPHSGQLYVSGMIGHTVIRFLKEWSFFLLTLDSNVNIWQLLNSFQLWSKQPLQFSYSCLEGNIFLTMQLLFIKIFWQGRLDFGEQKTLTLHFCLWFECPLSSTRLWCVQNSHRT